MNSTNAKSKVAIIDDEVDMRESVAQWLQLSGFEPIAFDAAEPALKVIGPDFPGVVISDIRLYREGLERVLNADGRVVVRGVAAGAAEALEKLTEDVQVVLIDVGLANAMATIAAIRRALPARIVALGVADSDTDILACAEAGVHGYVGRDASLDELIQSVSNAVRGELQCSPRIAASLLSRITSLATQSRPGTPVAESITRREQQILALLRTGRSNKEIASRLCIEVATVKNHVHNILSKCGARRRSELAGRSFEALDEHD